MGRDFHTRMRYYRGRTKRADSHRFLEVAGSRL